jgi:RimJ/RimL family protein N-acetyltransferase
MFSDQQARRFYPTTADGDGPLRWIEWNRESYRRHGHGLWAVEHATSGGFLGDCGLTVQHVEGMPVIEIGYHLVADARGHGYATEAACAVLDHGFATLDVEMLCSIVDPRNSSSARVAGRIHTVCRSFIQTRDREMLLFWTVRERRYCDDG